jgi:hypothetical protein
LVRGEGAVVEAMNPLPYVLLGIVGEDLVDKGPSCMIMISVKLIYNLLRALLTCHAGGAKHDS